VSKLKLTSKTRGSGQETRIAQYIRKLKKTTKLVFFQKKCRMIKSEKKISQKNIDLH
jgi:hypothetical protein